MEWIAVEDRLPETNNYYFVTWVFEHRVLTGEVWYDSENRWVFPSYGCDKGLIWPPPPVLYWMELPEPPPVLANQSLKPTSAAHEAGECAAAIRERFAEEKSNE